MTAYNCPTELKLLPCFNTTFYSHKTKYQMVCAFFTVQQAKKHTGVIFLLGFSHFTL